MDWQPIQKPAEAAENRLLQAILSGHFPIQSSLPGERELAEQLGVTRPTLREALQRLARDGWLDIQQGRQTRVRDYWHEGSLAVLSVLARLPSQQPADFVIHLLEVRSLLAPAYARQAVQNAGAELARELEGFLRLEDVAPAFAQADWDLHCLLTQRADNPVFRLLLNGFHDLYLLMGCQYFDYPECRRHSGAFYQTLLDCSRRGAAGEAEALTRRVMQESQMLWKSLQSGRS
jgi:GntR family negative regulator for fad regulon and positive regulator of fabA